MLSFFERLGVEMFQDIDLPPIMNLKLPEKYLHFKRILNVNLLKHINI